MIKNKKARRPARQLRFIKLSWLRRCYMFTTSSQRLLSIKHMHALTKQTKSEFMEKTKLEVDASIKKINRLVRQIRNCKLK